ncbi:hypothetical protein Q6D67_02245 [Haliea sp. E1-2-M8]|uniref:hypothetical protein n=1 Tax=Haliea sp. E1-2-M8 TaxID=3064706 RepID=UPI00272316FA|nr:hypothetical protein [Haliea sp. E1-2-M8]MDO8860506.1 hypothetical protein [Haliea sp. E1-2-M8]
MKYPPLENKLRTYRFEQLQTRYMLRYWFQGIIALISVMALLVALFREQALPAAFLVLAAGGFSLVTLTAGYLGRKRALQALRSELPPGETYEPPRELF